MCFGSLFQNAGSRLCFRLPCVAFGGKWVIEWVIKRRLRRKKISHCFQKQKKKYRYSVFDSVLLQAWNTYHHFPLLHIHDLVTRHRFDCNSCNFFFFFFLQGWVGAEGAVLSVFISFSCLLFVLVRVRGGGRSRAKGCAEKLQNQSVFAVSLLALTHRRAGINR